MTLIIDKAHDRREHQAQLCYIGDGSSCLLLQNQTRLIHFYRCDRTWYLFSLHWHDLCQSSQKSSSRVLSRALQMAIQRLMVGL